MRSRSAKAAPTAIGSGPQKINRPRSSSRLFETIQATPLFGRRGRSASMPRKAVR
jgi:hypothetical protein